MVIVIIIVEQRDGRRGRQLGPFVVIVVNQVLTHGRGHHALVVLVADCSHAGNSRAHSTV